VASGRANSSRRAPAEALGAAASASAVENEVVRGRYIAARRRKSGDIRSDVSEGGFNRKMYRFA
jgi:hypothetical protein